MLSESQLGEKLNSNRGSSRSFPLRGGRKSKVYIEKAPKEVSIS
jgi:hypothetical protein